MMKTSADKTQKNKSRAVANTVSRKQSSGGTFQLVDNRPETVQLQKLQEIIANSPHAKKIAQFQAMMDNSKNPHHVQLQKMQEMIANSQLGKTAVLPGVLQKKGPLDEDELQFKSKEAVQKKGPLDEDELQFKKDETVQCKGPLDEEELQFKAEEPVQKQENKTGLPDDLKAGVENLSGMAMDDVRVHYNSGKPAQLNAYAYTQGTEIHVAPGQEKHLPHEAWHVVQQKQGRVQPTMQMAGGVAVNDDKGLEREADVMGGKALQMVRGEGCCIARPDPGVMLGSFERADRDGRAEEMGLKSTTTSVGNGEAVRQLVKWESHGATKFNTTWYFKDNDAAKIALAAELREMANNLGEDDWPLALRVATNRKEGADSALRLLWGTAEDNVRRASINKRRREVATIGPAIAELGLGDIAERALKLGVQLYIEGNLNGSIGPWSVTEVNRAIDELNGGADYEITDGVVIRDVHKATNKAAQGKGSVYRPSDTQANVNMRVLDKLVQVHLNVG